jgi:hypothetical protein
MEIVMNDFVELANGKTVAWDEFAKWSKRKQTMNIINPTLGFIHTEKSRLKMSESKREKIANGELVFAKGDDHVLSNPILTPKGIFKSKRSAAEAYGVSAQRISAWINNPNKPEFKYVDDSFKKYLTVQVKLKGKDNPNSRAVQTPLGEFPSVTSACKALGITIGIFYNRLKHNRNKSEYFYIDGKGVGDYLGSRKGLKGGSNGSARRVMTPFGEFNSVREAYIALKIDMTTLYKRLNSDDHPEYYYSDKKIKKEKKLNENRAKGSTNAASRAVITPLGRFSTIREAHTALGISRPTLINRIRDKNYVDYRYDN